jgi:hypothetical protein
MRDMADKDIIANSLGMNPLEKGAVEIFKEAKRPPDDYEYARQNLYDAIEKGSGALEDIIDIAKQSESPRAFEVATNLIKTIVDANKDLLELAKRKKELEKIDNPEGPQTVNNNLFVGSSAELLKMLKNKSEE